MNETRDDDHRPSRIAGFYAGDAVWYRQTIRGGYGFAHDVPAIFVRATHARVFVRVQLRRGGEVDVAVHPKNVRPRDPAAV